MLNGTWPQIRQIKIRQSPKFSNSPNFSPSKISRYTVHVFAGNDTVSDDIMVFLLHRPLDTVDISLLAEHIMHLSLFLSLS